MTRHLQKLIHVGCRELGIDGESRRDLQLVVTGKESMADMSEVDLDRMLTELKRRGFKPSATGRRRAAERGDVRFAHVLWGKLVRAGVMHEAGAAGLNAFIRARFAKAWGATPIDVDAMRDWEQIAAVIQALKTICTRNGIDLGKPE